MAGHELEANEQGGKGSDPAEDAEGDGQRLDRSIDLGLDGCDGVEAVGVAGRCRQSELPLHRIHVAVSVVELEPIGDGPCLPSLGHDLSSEGRGEEDERRVLVDVVLDDGVALLDQPHQRGVDTDVWRDLGGAEARQVRLSGRVDAVRDDVANVEAEQVRGCRSHHDLVAPVGVGQAPGGHGQSILVEEQSVDAGDRLDVVDGAQAGRAVPGQRGGGNWDGGLDVPYAREAGDRLDGRQ